MLPADLRNTTELLRDNWNRLNGQILGRGISPRSDIPKKVIDAVGEKYQAFRQWYDSLDFATEMFGDYETPLNHYVAEYQKARNLVTGSLPASERQKFISLEKPFEPSLMNTIIGVAVIGFLAVILLRNRQ